MVTLTVDPLELRVARAQTLFDEWSGRILDFKQRQHCGRLTLEHLRRMGHQPRVGRAGSFKTVLGARRALSRLGAANIGDLLDLHGFERIPPAAALPGDMIELPAEDGLGCLTVAIGNGRTFGWHPDSNGCQGLQPLAYGRAWRIEPR